MSGKYGKLEGPVSKVITDPFSSIQPGTAAFIGDKSIVIHYANTTRLTCANFELVGAPPSESCNTDTPTTIVASSTLVTPPTGVPVYPPVETPVTPTPNVTPTPPPVAGAAAVHFSVPLMVAGFAAIFFAL